MAERIHVYEGPGERKFYFIAPSTSHRTNIQVKWKGVSKPVSDAKNLTLIQLEKLELLGEKDLPKETEEKTQSVSAFLRNLAEKVSKE